MIESSGSGSSRRYYSAREIRKMKEQLKKSYDSLKKKEEASKKLKEKEEILADKELEQYLGNI